MSEEKKPEPFSNWEPCISTEIGEKAQCERCKRVIESRTMGEHIFCGSCNKYIWREK